MNVNLCIPTLNRYDLLMKCIESAEAGTLKPSHYFIIDNGTKLNFSEFTNIFSKEIADKIVLIKVKHNVGVAKSWNWFFNNVEDEILISNDDIEFYEDSIEKLMDGYDENFTIYPAEGATSFALMAYPRKIINDVGQFDETLSPFYAYFEDNDYHWRMRLKGYNIKDIAGCRVKHENSGTLKKFTPLEMRMHHEKFRLAQYNYFQKWGGIPPNEKFTVPYNGAINDSSRKDNSGRMASV